MADSVRLLMVCLGNICRSPTAEGIVRARVTEAGLANRVTVDSAGTGDWHVDCSPDPRAIATAAGHGVDISHLRGRQLSARDFDEFEWLLCADRSNLRDVRALAPDAAARSRVQLLLDWAGVEADAEVPDPYTGGADQFEHVWRLLERAADGVVRRLR